MVILLDGINPVSTPIGDKLRIAQITRRDNFSSTWFKMPMLPHDILSVGSVARCLIFIHWCKDEYVCQVVDSRLDVPSIQTNVFKNISGRHIGCIQHLFLLTVGISWQWLQRQKLGIAFPPLQFRGPGWSLLQWRSLVSVVTVQVCNQFKHFFLFQWHISK